MAEMPLDALLEALAGDPSAVPPVPSPLDPAPNVYDVPPAILRAPAIIAEPSTPWFSGDPPARFPTMTERWQIWAVVNANSDRAGIEWLRAAAMAAIDAARRRGIMLESVDPPVVREHAGVSYWATRVGLKAQTEV